MSKVYLAGDMLNRGAQMQRSFERDIIKGLGHELYNPMDNKDINDKKNAAQDGLAERIVYQDTDAINWSDTVVIEPLVHAVGTCVELGQIKGMRDVSLQVVDLIHSLDLLDTDPDETVSAIYALCEKHVKRKVIPHNSDIRRDNTTPQTGDRREYGAHQYVYGVVLELTEGKGFYSWEEVEKELA